jgi:hypothetical protein
MEHKPRTTTRRGAIAEGAITRINQADLENHQLFVLSNSLRSLYAMKQDEFTARHLVPVEPTLTNRFVFLGPSPMNWGLD